MGNPVSEARREHDHTVLTKAESPRLDLGTKAYAKNDSHAAIRQSSDLL